MFRNYLVAALRNLARNKLYSAITVVGLAIGFAAALFIALFVRDEFSYDGWIPGYEDIYRISAGGGGRAPTDLAGFLGRDVHSVRAVGRLAGAQVGLRHENVEAVDSVFWADPEIFSVMRLPVFAGDLQTALVRPDSIVMTRAMARKYFGRDQAVGETIEIDRLHPMIVTAVLEDFPSNTNLDLQMFVSSRAPFSRLAQLDAMPNRLGLTKPFIARTFVRLAPGASTGELKTYLAAAGARVQSGGQGFVVQPIATVHLYALREDGSMPPDALASLYMISAIAALIVLIAAINFINLMTARAARRSVEVGIRKVSGAARRDLVLQFLGESLIYVGFSMAVAFALEELLLPTFNAFLGRAIAVDYRQDFSLMAASAGMAVVVGVLAGLYPAFVLSAFRPVVALKPGIRQSDGDAVRPLLVLAQFAILIGLIVATAATYRQLVYARTEALRLDSDQVLLIAATDCKDAFKDQVRNLPGVRDVACSQSYDLVVSNLVPRANGTGVQLVEGSVGFGFFELFGMKPLAGRFFAADRPADAAAADGGASRQPPLVINETAVRRFGFASPEAAIGKTILLPRILSVDGQFAALRPAEIIGVVPDFTVRSIRQEIAPMAFFVDPALFGFLTVKLSGRALPETLQAIDRIWSGMGNQRPIQRNFLDQRLQNFYLDVIRQGQMFAAFAGIALLIACLGLFGLAAFTAERRTKEIGIRKAMGAKTTDILRLLIWEFAQPVLWANLIAWPVAYYFMNRWLEGFAYHIDLAPWMFLAAGALALFIALATVSVHSLFVARAKPIEALRYE